MMESKKVGNHLYVWHDGQLVYKRWLKRDERGGYSNEKAQPSMLINNNGWPNEQIYP